MIKIDKVKSFIKNKVFLSVKKNDTSIDDYLELNNLLSFDVNEISSDQQFIETIVNKFEKISDNLYQVLGGRGSNGGAYIGDNGVLLIEAKMNESSVIQTMAELKKITDKPVTYLVSTHSDGDHINGNRYFPESVIFIAHENCRSDFFLPKRDGSPSDWLTWTQANYSGISMAGSEQRMNLQVVTASG